MTTKSYVSVICEYNPFHFGHKFQMDKLLSEFDGVICIQSGDIVQRGSVAVADKYLRAQAAVKNGASLVLELPLPWCCSSARDFASAGVHIANAVGAEYLAFGAEDDLATLLKIEGLMSEPEFAEILKAKVNSNENISYPATLKALVGEELGESFAEAVQKPNNILGLEYLSSLKNTNLKPFVVKRKGELLSSSAIRAKGVGADMLKELPEESKKVFASELNKGFPRDIKKLDSFFIGTLRRLNSAGQYTEDLYSVPKDLFNKLVSSSVCVNSVDELIIACTDKIYTRSRVRRALNAMVFGITAQKVHSAPPYTCVLAADEKGREILRNAKKLNKIEIITKPVRATEASEQTREAFLFAKGIEDIIALSAPVPESAEKGKTPFILK